MTAYNLHDKIHNGKIYMSISKGIYRLKKAGTLANQQLQQHLAPYGYTPIRYTPGLWKHNSNQVIFGLIINNFIVKYTNKENIQYLVNTLKGKYKGKLEW